MVMIVDADFAHTYFPNEDPIGKRVNLAFLNFQAEIVGVVGHVEHWGLGSKQNQNLAGTDVSSAMAGA